MLIKLFYKRIEFFIIKKWVKKFSSGFTLIEILVTISIIAFMSILVLGNFSSIFRVNLNTFTRELSSAYRECYEESILKRRVYRIGYNLDTDPQEYWVEEGPPKITISLPNKRDEFFADKKKEENEGEKSQFQLAKKITKKKRKLPNGVKIIDIINTQSTMPIIGGTTYTHFFPHGFAEKTIIHLKDNSEHNISLVVMPLTGKVRIYERYYKENEKE